ncbi:MAG TPA: ribosome biogenesis GTPase Der [Acidimicrobiales bacterium]|jgi:GTP-binding protein|nr:ribosome biogenesis GTPase Der [Acidimicrobiales bacterium]
MDLPVVAIVGRPNVGKSTLLNRVVGKRVAIVEEKPGVTRDRKDLDAQWRGRDFRIVDTGGWMVGGDSLDRKVSQQSERAVADADVVLFVVDVTTGITEEDSRVAEMLRRSGKTVLLVANKVDDRAHDGQVWEMVSLGLGDPLAVSALHGRGSGDLLDQVIDLLPPVDADAQVEGEGGDPDGDGAVAEYSDDSAVAVAIVGRPNVGKSTLYNRLIGDERAVVHDMPGTTRDAIDTVIETELGRVRLVDTAGMRRKSRISEGTEYYSMVRALEAVDNSDVALMVIDATEGITGQDQRLAERVDAAGCPIVLLLNKWELLDTDQRAELRWQVGDKLRFIGEAPVLPISAINGRGVHKLLPALEGSIDAYRRRVPTRKVNEVIQAAQLAQPAPGGARVLYATQGATDPPTFTLFANRELPRTYLRYLERKLREAFGLGATPVKLRVRRRTS